MEREIQKLLDSLAALRSKADVNAAFGEPVATEGRTVIPVAEVAYSFEVGVEGEAADEIAAGGGSGGMSARPLAVIEVTPQSTVVRPIIDEQKLALAGALLVGWAVFCVARALVKILGQRE